MKLAYAGTAPFGAAILERLAAEHHVELVISQPDRPAGRGRKLTSPPVARLARDLGLPLVQPERTHDDEVLELLRSSGVDTIVVAAFGQLIREPLLSEFLMLNVHGSVLPRYRGAAPIERAIMDGCETTGVCIMRMDAGLDTGPVASCQELAIALDDDAGALYARAAEAGGQLLLDALERAQRGTLAFEPQPDDGVSYAHKITAADRWLDFASPARAVHDRIRALSPHIGAVCEIDGQRVTLWRSSIQRDDAARLAPGAIRHDTQTLEIGCSDATLVIHELQPPGKRRMPTGDWLRGLRAPLSRASAPTLEHRPE